MTEVKVGQVWQSNDPRDKGRRFQVDDIDVMHDQASVRNLETGRRTQIRADRLLNSCGKREYSLIEG